MITITLKVIFSLFAILPSYMFFERHVSIYPDLGIAYERTGVSYSHYGHLYIPITVSIPTMVKTPIIHNTNHSLHCNISVIVNSKVAEMNDFLTFILEEKKVNIKARNKRFIPIAALGLGALSTGMTFWNRYDISSIKDHISVLEMNENRIQEKLQTLVSYDNTIIQGINKVHHVLSDHTEKINTIIKNLECSGESTIKLITSVQMWINFVSSEFIRAVDFATLGKITPDIIPSSSLRKIIQNTDELKNSPYEIDPYLIYNLGETILLSVTNNPHSISALIILPHITSDSIGSVFQLASVPITTNSTLHRISLPPMAIQELSGSFWTPDSSLCTIGSFYTICHVSVKENYPELCLTELSIFNKTDSCMILSKKITATDKTEVYQMMSGLLVGASQNIGTLLVSSGTAIISRKMSLDATRSTFLSPDMGRSLMIDNMIYTIGTHHDSVSITLLANISLNLESADLEQLKEEAWIELPNIPDSYITPLKDAGGWFWDILIFILIITSLGACFLLWKKHKWSSQVLYDTLLVIKGSQESSDILPPTQVD